MVERNNGIVEANGSTPLRSNSQQCTFNAKRPQLVQKMFETLELLPNDPVLGIPALFNKDTHPKKVNLSVGAYQDGEGRAYVLESIRDVEKILSEQHLLKNYLPIEGDQEFIKLSGALVFGEKGKTPFFGAQTVGGTSALRLGGDLLERSHISVIALSNPSWPNHAPVFKQSGLQVIEYPYYDQETHQINFPLFLDALQKMPARTAVLLHACCHNPTGMDLNQKQWQQTAEVIKSRGLIPFFDFAYQGFGESLEADAYAVRLFAEMGIEMLVASSFSKNMGLYGERAGFFAVLMEQAVQDRVASQVKQLIRCNYSNPPLHPARLVSTILKDPDLKKGWERELNTMRDRVQCMREALAFGLASQGAQRDFSFLMRQRGVFSFSGLTPSEVDRLRKDWGIYLLDNGRMNVAGLNQGNLDTVIKAIIAVTNAR